MIDPYNSMNSSLKIKNFIFFGFYLLFNPLIILKLLNRVYLPVYIQYIWLKKYHIKTIIDIGAHNGEVSHSLSQIFPAAEIYAFEPIKSKKDIILSKNKSKRFHLSDFALNDKNGKEMFYQTQNTALSSLFPVIRNKVNLDPGTIQRVRVKTITLDNFFKDMALIEPILIKLDTQGTELNVLKGGEKLLKKVSVIHIETSFEHFYQGQPLFDQIYLYLKTNGFRYIGEARESFFYPIFEPMNQINSIFIKDKKFL